MKRPESRVSGVGDAFHDTRRPTPDTRHPTMDDPQRYLDPLALANVRDLELRARLIVEGYLSGMHKSPYHGFSGEFAEHREYVPGDDLKHLDSKVSCPTAPLYLHQYEQETNPLPR